MSKYYDVKTADDGRRFIQPNVLGSPLLGMPLLNKGTAFTAEEREQLELTGLLPPHTATLEEQKQLQYEIFSHKSSDMEKYIFLRSLQDRNEVLFFALVADHVVEMLPILYTPVVGEAVKHYSHIYRSPRGYSFTTEERGGAAEGLANVPLDDVRLAVATDSSAILGIGDQGYGGMGISIGKLTIYTVAGGVAPDTVLPIELDVGTNRKDLLEDPMYLGARHERLTGDKYFEFIDEFVQAFKDRYPNAVMQWEDFSKDAAFAVLERYREVLPSFNDDIQGTGAVALAGVLSACRIKGEELTQQKILVYGAGAGGVGVANAMIAGLMREGLNREEASARVYVLDSKGLLLTNRKMENYKRKFARAPESVASWGCAGQAPDLLETVVNAGITVLLGLSGQWQKFTQQVTTAMEANTRYPVIYPLSNPNSSSEATPEDLIHWTGGKVVVAVGSPFPDVIFQGRKCHVGQGNNAFVFPGIGFGAVLSKAKMISDEMVLEGAYALYDYTSRKHAARTYPPISELRDVSQYVAARVISMAVGQGLARDPRVLGKTVPEIEKYVQDEFWEPKYLPFQVPK
jgi:malate dehydrogenase (oxaloacetate-decarboxylating)